MRARLCGALALLACVGAAAVAGYAAQVSRLPDGRTMMVDVPAGPVRGVALARRFNPPAQVIHAGIEADVIGKIVSWVGAQRSRAERP